LACSVDPQASRELLFTTRHLYKGKSLRFRDKKAATASVATATEA